MELIIQKSHYIYTRAQQISRCDVGNECQYPHCDAGSEPKKPVRGRLTHTKLDGNKYEYVYTRGSVYIHVFPSTAC